MKFELHVPPNVLLRQIDESGCLTQKSACGSAAPLAATAAPTAELGPIVVDVDVDPSGLCVTVVVVVDPLPLSVVVVVESPLVDVPPPLGEFVDELELCELFVTGVPLGTQTTTPLTVPLTMPCVTQSASVFGKGVLPAVHF